jgi:hypothetical protein
VVREAEWIYREPPDSRIARPRDGDWRAIDTADELEAWARAWDGDGAPHGLFRPALLRDPSVTILGGYADGSIVAGAIANRTGDGIFGLSNLFADDGDLDRAWSGSLGYLDTVRPGAAVVGYESGADLEIARRRGFRSVGRLRIWLAAS